MFHTKSVVTKPCRFFTCSSLIPMGWYDTSSCHTSLTSFIPFSCLLLPPINSPRETPFILNYQFGFTSFSKNRFSFTNLLICPYSAFDQNRSKTQWQPKISKKKSVYNLLDSSCKSLARIVQVSINKIFIQLAAATRFLFSFRAEKYKNSGNENKIQGKLKAMRKSS